MQLDDTRVERKVLVTARLLQELADRTDGLLLHWRGHVEKLPERPVRVGSPEQPHQLAVCRLELAPLRDGIDGPKWAHNLGEQARVDRLTSRHRLSHRLQRGIRRTARGVAGQRNDCAAHTRAVDKRVHRKVVHKRVTTLAHVGDLQMARCVRANRRDQRR